MQVILFVFTSSQLLASFIKCACDNYWLLNHTAGVFVLAMNISQCLYNKIFDNILKVPGEFLPNGINLTTFHLFNGSVLLAIQMQVISIRISQFVN